MSEKTLLGPGPGRNSLCLAGDERGDVKSTWAGPCLQLHPTPTSAGQRPGGRCCTRLASLCLWSIQKRSPSEGCALPSGGGRERSWLRHSGGEGEKGLLFAQEGSRHWGPCPGAAGELLARWRAAGGWGRRGGEEGFQAQPSASSSQPPASFWACPRPREGQPPLPPR